MDYFSLECGTWIVFLQIGPNQPGFSIFPGYLLFPFFSIYIIPPRFPAASNSTTVGALIGERQYGRMKTFLCFLNIIETNVGFGSTKSPVQLYFISKYKVLDFISPSKAPASTKKRLLLFEAPNSTKEKFSICKLHVSSLRILFLSNGMIYFIVTFYYFLFLWFSSFASVHR